jgi:hypothetical protein
MISRGGLRTAFLAAGAGLVLTALLSVVTPKASDDLMGVGWVAWAGAFVLLVPTYFLTKSEQTGVRLFMLGLATLLICVSMATTTVIAFLLPGYLRNPFVSFVLNFSGLLGVGAIWLAGVALLLSIGVAASRRLQGSVRKGEEGSNEEPAE